MDSTQQNQLIEFINTQFSQRDNKNLQCCLDIAELGLTINGEKIVNLVPVGDESSLPDVEKSSDTRQKDTLRYVLMTDAKIGEGGNGAVFAGVGFFFSGL